MYEKTNNLKLYSLLIISILFCVHFAVKGQEIFQSEKEVLKQANKNIQIHRKGNFTVVITNSRGEPLKNVDVNIIQSAHAFHFGAIIFELLREGTIQSENVEQFKEKFSHLFNYAVFPFYWAAYESKPGHPAWYRMEEIIEWCQERGITCKSHPLAWTHTAGTPSWIYKIPNFEATELLKSKIITTTMGFKGQSPMTAYQRIVIQMN